MQTKYLCAAILTAVFLAPFTDIVRGARESGDVGQGHLSGLSARIILRDGSSRIVTIEGVGCTASICSRKLIKTKTSAEAVVTTWLDSVAAIRDITPGNALFVLKNGTSQHLSLLPGFRVLYLKTRLGGAEKLDLAQIQAVESADISK
jgi:hypothetical protein